MALPPGPELGALLAGLDLALIPNDHVVDVLRAHARQVAHEQARMLAAIVEVGRSTPFPDPTDAEGRKVLGARRLMAVHEWASGEIAAALTLTSTAADRELSFADTVVTRLPQVFAALSAGLIDRPKAWVFADHLDDLIAEQIAAICSVLVPMAPRLTTGRLRARLVRMIQEIDPEHARRRYQKAVRERCVVGYLDRDGTATINASGLPVDEAAAACERLELLGETVKRAGHPGRLAQIQTDLFLGMLDGRFHGLTEKQIVTELLARSREDRPCPAPARTRSGRLSRQRYRLDRERGVRRRHGWSRHVLHRRVRGRGVGCRRPARKSDKDHTHDHARGGATTSRNIGPGCDRHHLYKHEGGWCLGQPEPGHFVWTSPLGRAYRTRGAPISPPVVAPCPAPSDPGGPPTSRPAASPRMVRS
ncbi:DUF222 domain-containing protein [Pseudonocardia sp.]|uniref:HNH endonuclease signature motif containing protein n=1 Tax=Pseudonocardia sp. TaxID=60912 RepID=UPI0031FC9D86